ILFNILFAWLVLSLGFMVGMPSTIDHQGYGQVTNARPTVVAILPGSPADKSGVEYGDVILEVDTATTQFNLRTLNTDRQAESVHDFLAAHAGESIVLRMERDGTEKDFVVKAADGVVGGRKAIGIELDDVGVLRLPVHLALAQGALVGWDLL